jgi:hypothetical protein
MWKARLHWLPDYSEWSLKLNKVKPHALKLPSEFVATQPSLVQSHFACRKKACI